MPDQIDQSLKRVAQILFPLPLAEAFDYLVPDEMVLGLGDIVDCPLGPRQQMGVVWGLKEKPADEISPKIKPIVTRRDSAPIGAEMRAFVDWCARYLVALPGQMLVMVLRARDAFDAGPFDISLALAPDVEGDNSLRLTPARERALAALRVVAPKGMSRAGLSAVSGASGAVIAGLIKAGKIVQIKTAQDTPFDAPDFSLAHAPLSDDQQRASDDIAAFWANGPDRPILLDGVTGSGKTEVYLDILAKRLAEDPKSQALILLPEIALTEAIMDRMAARFGTRPVTWHSQMTPAERRRAYRMILSGNASIVLGARSAIMLPFANLGLIIVDEEHDGAYKQDDGLRYHARDLAVVRAKLSGAGIILASATPSLESLSNAQMGRYHHVPLLARFGSAKLPDVRLIDLKNERPEPGAWLSPPLIEAMAERLEKGEQSLLFLNRRGFAPLVLCRACGHKMKAPDSDSWLVEHRYIGRLVCHLTGFSMPKPDRCPACGTVDGLISVGPGVERIGAEVAQTFPNASVAVISSDLAGSAERLAATFQAVTNGEIDIIIGTQILAKGHNFPLLTLVGIVDADLGLKGGDPRAAERSYALISQVAGRAGRFDKPGLALVQTHYPDSETMLALAAQDRGRFMAEETQARKDLGLPPFGRMAFLHLLSREPDKLNLVAAQARAAAPLVEGAEIWGPAPPPLAMVRGWHRLRFMVRADRGIDVSALMSQWRGRLKPLPSVRLTVDIEPYSFL